MYPLLFTVKSYRFKSFPGSVYIQIAFCYCNLLFLNVTILRWSDPKFREPKMTLRHLIPLKMSSAVVVTL